MFFFFAGIEAAVLFPRYGPFLLTEARTLFSISYETALGTKEYDSGETRERGFSLDIKSGEVKWWQKVERTVTKKTD
ncbi:hypothetical protein [Clostridium sp. HBUAS56010]|uniref:hypothetical protein n=1 Tax=Clostridium sp. HBUAS56010 TaxID=2571127 RepID=UPI00117741C5|nr:hypothetical protein [Clostridium sp. HBUAS56010]